MNRMKSKGVGGYEYRIYHMLNVHGIVRLTQLRQNNRVTTF